jgi:putative transposase
MVSPAARRRACDALLKAGFSRVRSCRMAGLSRSSSRKAKKDRNPELRERVLELSRRHPRFGFRRIHMKLEGVNIKAVRRIWREEGLLLKRRKRRRLKVPVQPRYELSAANQAWCLDFCHDRLENGRAFRILAVLDCFTRECLLLKASPHFPSSSVQRELEWLFLVHGKPQRLVSDNGPEFRALTLPEGVEAAFIQPGSPWQNGHVESFFDKLRDELLSRELFASGAELQAHLDDHTEYYNHRRPHRSLQGLAPASFKDRTSSKMPEAEELKL